MKTRPRTIRDAERDSARWDADPASTRVVHHHARHQAREHASLLAPLGAGCELTGSVFGGRVRPER